MTTSPNPKEIYGWHIVHSETGMPYAFCLRSAGNSTLTESDVLSDFENPDDWTLIPLVRAGILQ